MKKFDLVELINEKPYAQYNLEKSMHGIVVDILSSSRYNVVFFNPRNIGDYIIVAINADDIILDKEKLPANIKNELICNLKEIMRNANNSFEDIKIKPYSGVELAVENSKYSKFGLHKGDIGIVVDSFAVRNNIEVDFSGIDDNGEYYGDCIGVDIDDLKIIE